MIDDSALFHAGAYDPQKAHDYYLRTRKLKGRKPREGQYDAGRGRQYYKQVQQLTGKSSGDKNRADTKSRQAELAAQKAALQKRLDRLRDVLADLVDAAKKRSGGDPNKSKDSEKNKAPETQVDKADRNKAEKKAKPETAAQKKEKAKKAKDAYEKEHPTSLSQDIDVLKEQVADIQHKIEAALSQARARRERQQKAGNNKPDRPAQNTNNDSKSR